LVEGTIRSLFSKYESTDNASISELILSVPENFSIAINRIKSSESWSVNTIASKNDSSTILKNRIKLQEFINSYHLEAQTLTGNVLNRIKLLNKPNTEILVSIHQPNLFPYGGIFKKIILLEAIKNTIEKCNEEKKIINLFVIVDHDFMDEIWVRVAQLPSIHHSSGILNLRMPVDSKRRWLMIKNMPLPTRVILDNWRQQILSWIKKLSDYSFIEIDKPSIFHNFEVFWNEVENSYLNAKSYSDFNSFLMSSIVNKKWNYGTLFVRLSDLSFVFQDGIKYLVSNYEKYSQILRKSESMFNFSGIDSGISPSISKTSPLWLNCKCGSKASTKIKQQNEIMFLVGTCRSCKTDLQLCLGNKNDLDLSVEILQNLSPRAIPILLLLSRDLGINCYVSGTAGLKYIIFGSELFNELSIDMPLIMVWPSRDIYRGIGQSDALNSLNLPNDIDVDTYLKLLSHKNYECENKIKPLLDDRKLTTKTGKSISQKLSRDFYDLKEEQRKVRQQIGDAKKVKNAIDLSPCFIDYAVNFGIKNIGMQWYNSLLKENNFAAPLFLNIK